ncbi:MAG: hypothetical protein AABY64_09675 [Bdellovibrionota bacterium]|mgnify:CR=1 FL=1
MSSRNILKNLQKSAVATVFVFAAILQASPCALAAKESDLLFEGYHKLMSGGVHIGYTISRYEYDPKSKKFTATIFTKTGALGSDVTESTHAVADADLNPVSYEYTAMVGKDIKTIDAKFKKNHMSAVVKEKGKIQKIEQDIPKGVFLSQFLIYLMLKSKNGLQADLNYKYKAIAEEDGKFYDGQALVTKQEKYNGYPAFKILNNYKDLKFVAYVTDRGEVLGVTNPAQNLAIELKPKPNDATGQFGVGASILRNLFGDVPLGTHNVLSRAMKAEALKPEEPENPKRYGVPPGQGIIIKPQPAPPVPAPAQPQPTEKEKKKNE